MAELKEEGGVRDRGEGRALVVEWIEIISAD